jgi:hypothetical protein
MVVEVRERDYLGVFDHVPYLTSTIDHTPHEVFYSIMFPFYDAST